MKNPINISNQSKDTGGSRKTVALTQNDLLRRRFILKNRRIGISISECENLEELGFGINHLKDVMIETAKYILSLGGSLSYGGDLRNGGFTEVFFDLLNYYNLPEGNTNRLYSYLAWPLYLNLTKEKEAQLINNVSFIKVPPPEDVYIKNLKDFLPPTTGENQYIWSRSLSHMRAKMENECDARIFLGGKFSGFKGKYPGVLEEITLALDDRHPIYLIGAFGGITKEVTDVLNKNKKSVFDENYLDTEEDYKELKDNYFKKDATLRIDYKNINENILNIGWEGLSSLNGLSINDNKRLSETPHINEIIFLIIKGLTNKFRDFKDND